MKRSSSTGELEKMAKKIRTDELLPINISSQSDTEDEDLNMNEIPMDIQLLFRDENDFQHPSIYMSVRNTRLLFWQWCWANLQIETQLLCQLFVVLHQGSSEINTFYMHGSTHCGKGTMIFNCVSKLFDSVRHVRFSRFQGYAWNKVWGKQLLLCDNIDCASDDVRNCKKMISGQEFEYSKWTIGRTPIFVSTTGMVELNGRQATTNLYNHMYMVHISDIDFFTTDRISNLMQRRLPNPWFYAKVFIELMKLWNIGYKEEILAHAKDCLDFPTLEKIYNKLD